MQVELSPTWKEEVRGKVAAHKSRKSGLPADGALNRQGSGRRGSEAAARVAERFANAPSYNEMLAEEARTAVRAAKAATRAAQQAQAAAQSLFASLEAASEAERGWESVAETAAMAAAAREEAQKRFDSYQASLQQRSAESQRQPYGVRWEADFPVRDAGRTPGRPESVEERWDPAVFERAPAEVVEPGPVTHANLIEFPRELVATRKMRPRRAEGPYGAVETKGQLSIFEVDPASVSTIPEGPESAAVVWPEWPEVRLDRVEAPAELERAGAAAQVESALPLIVEDFEPVAAEVLEVAPISWRLLAAMVDGSLITGAFLAAAMVAMSRMAELPGPRATEMGGGLALAGTAVLYQMLFFTLGKTTPGMRYARLSLQTLGNGQTTRGERWKRLGAMMLSLAPMGLGAVWALFDEQHLSWHDRLSGTYLRRE
jgi:uncharacterized RDD family membrane protein YckC